MCALLGMDFADPLFAGFSFREFGRWSDENADGWGLAWYTDASASLIKEPVRWRSSPHMEFLNQYQQIRSHIYIAHVRHRTVGGEPSHADTHPFQRECWGRDYCFAHNGTITQPKKHLPLDRYHPVGATDSERLFCHLLDCLVKEGKHPLDDERNWLWLHQKLQACNRHGKLNAVFSDGKRLFCYRDLGGWKGLAYCHVHLMGSGKSHFEDPNLHIAVAGETMNQGMVVATYPLNDHGWLNLELGELMVIQKGQLQFSSHRALGGERLVG